VPAFRARREETLMMHFEASGVVLVLSSVRFFMRFLIATRTKAREVRMEPSRFVRRTWEMLLGEVWGRTREVEIPAALMRMVTDC
jgi:hypothetical protein